MGTSIRFCALAVVVVGTAWFLAAGTAGEDQKASRQVRVFGLHRVKATVIAKTLSELLRDNKDIRIVADEHTNSLVVEAPPKDVERLVPLLDLLEQASHPSDRDSSPPPLLKGLAPPAEPESGGRRQEQSPTPAKDEAERTSCGEARRLIGSLDQRVQELQARVSRLEADARCRTRYFAPGEQGEDLQARVGKLEADARIHIMPLPNASRQDDR
jgi:hypothetical protein